jgi:hypothetical protein
MTELDKLNLTRSRSKNLLVRAGSHTDLSNRGAIIKRCSLKNLNLYEESTMGTGRGAKDYRKLPSYSKKHILDRILARLD